MNGNKLRAHIFSAGYTQGKLAREIGISPNTMSAKINGKSPFDTIEIERICRILGITSSKDKAEIFLSHPSQKRDGLKKVSPPG